MTDSTNIAERNPFPRNLAEVLQQNAERVGDAVWLITPENSRRYRWREAYERAVEISCRLHAVGLRPGASVAIASHNSAVAVFAFLGITLGGFRAVPLNLLSGPRSLEFVLRHSQSELVLCADDCRALVDEALAVDGDATSATLQPRVVGMDEVDIRWGNIKASAGASMTAPDADQTALLIYTSGTTGAPKGVMLSHANLLAAARNVQHAHALQPSDVGMCVLPIYHINGLCVTVLGSLLSQGGLVMPRRFSNSRFWRDVNDFSCSWFSAVPTLFAYLLAEESVPKINSGRLRFARSASAALAPEIHREFERRFKIPIIETMGLTETGAQILSNPLPPLPRKIGSAGTAYGNEIRIGDENQQAVANDEEGEILVRGDNVMQGYFGDADATTATITADGWLRSGDLGRMDKDGYVFVTGRIKELIIKGGENIAPREVDEALLEHEAVLEAAAFAVPCDHYGQEVCACVVLKRDQAVTEDALREFCANKIGEYKTPKQIYFVEQLPKGPSGKIQRLKLVEWVGSE